MQGNLQVIRQTLSSSNKYEIPLYQRDYQWDSERWQALISDVVGAATAAVHTPKHWMGIFLISDITPVHAPGEYDGSFYKVIDGQQRLVTMTIWLAALAHESQERAGKDLARPKISEVAVQESDRIAYQIAMEGKWRNNIYFDYLAHPILRAYAYFRHIIWLGQEAVASEEPIKIKYPKQLNSEKTFEEQFADFLVTKRGRELPRGAATDLAQLNEATLVNLQIYSLIHEPDQDESQTIIFDTLNGMRTELEPLDHVRNSLFVRLSQAEGDKLYNTHWQPAEKVLREIKVKRLGAAKSFVYDYVISQGERSRQGSIRSTKGAVHLAHITNPMTESQLLDYLTDKVIPAMVAYPVVVNGNSNVVLKGVPIQIPTSVLQRLETIRELTSGPATPLALLYVPAYLKAELNELELLEALGLIESHISRRILADKDMSPLRAQFIEICSTIDKDLSLVKLKSTLKAASPVTDAEILACAETKEYDDLSAKAQGAIFRGIERQLSGIGSMWFAIGSGNADYSIEHLYPQSGARWAPDLAAWGVPEADMKPLLQTIGNLTAATNEHNKRVGNKRFSEKQLFPTTPGAAAPLSINTGWIDPAVIRWTPSEIKARSRTLINAALLRWPAIP